MTRTQLVGPEPCLRCGAAPGHTGECLDRILMDVTDSSGCDSCNSTGVVTSPLDHRLLETCPMCGGHGRLLDDEGEA
jgi:DnaJ-class molecular chaperone